MQKLSKTLAIMGLLTPLGASALGTGEIKLNSSLNQKLNAEVPLILSTAESAEDLRVNLAPPEAFDKAGIERPYYLGSLRFEVLVKGKATPTIRISSSEAIREPFVSFLVELQWSQGRLVREFTLLLDPPSTFKERSVAVRDLPRAEAAPTSFSEPGLHARPESFSGSEYGPVRAGETLWSIAKLAASGQAVSVEQMAVALLETNPAAFDKGSINRIHSGATLRVPDKSAAMRHSLADAKKIIDEHSGARLAKPAASTATPAKAGVPSAAPDSQATAGTKPLTLLAPESATDSGKKAPGDAAKGELALEVAETYKQENEEMRGRLTSLEQQLSLAQRLLTLKDAQIAALQAGKPMPSELEASTPPQPAQSAGPSPEVAVAEAAKPEVPAPSVSESPSATSVAAPAAVAEPAAPPPAEVVAKPEQAAAAQPAAPVAPVAAAPAATQQPTPRPPVAPPAVKPPPIEEPGFFDGSLTPMLLGVVGLLLGGLAFLAVKRRRAALAELDFETPVQEVRPINLSQSAIESRPQEAGASAGLNAPSQHGSFLSDFTPSDFDVLDSDNEAIDPISEADVYLAYGRYGQAEELIRQAINENPFRDECKLKLLEVFYTAQNRESFEKYVAELLDENKNSDQDFWARVLDMGRSLAPDNPIFGGGAKAETTATAEQAEPSPAAASGATAAAALDGVDFAFDLDSEVMPPAPATETASPTLQADIEIAAEALSAGLESLAEQPEITGASVEPPAPAADEEQGLSFDLGGLEPVSTATPLVEVETMTHEDGPALDLNFDMTALDISPLNAEPIGTSAAPSEQDDRSLSFDLSGLDAMPEPSPAAEAVVPDDEERVLEFDVSALQKTEKEAAIGEAEAAADTVEEQGRVLEFSVSPPQPTESASAQHDEEPSLDLSEFANMDLASLTTKQDKDDEFNFNMNFDMGGQALKDPTDDLDVEAPLDVVVVDEAETKLDLAKAYMDMDNTEAAKLMLQEVLEEGDERQKLVARELLGILAG